MKHLTIDSVSRTFGPACLLAALIALAPIARAEAAAGEPAKSPIPILATDPKVQTELLTLDQFLDKNPQIEEALRTNIEQAEQADFLKSNPAWEVQLKQRPDTIKALKAEQRFLMHRALARIARGPLLKDEVRQLDRFLDQHPEVLRPLEKRPALIADSAFLSAHAELGSFLTNHPALFTAFIDRAPGAKKKASKD